MTTKKLSDEEIRARKVVVRFPKASIESRKAILEMVKMWLQTDDLIEFSIENLCENTHQDTQTMVESLGSLFHMGFFVNPIKANKKVLIGAFGTTSQDVIEMLN